MTQKKKVQKSSLHSALLAGSVKGRLLAWAASAKFNSAAGGSSSGNRVSGMAKAGQGCGGGGEAGSMQRLWGWSKLAAWPAHRHYTAAVLGHRAPAGTRLGAWQGGSPWNVPAWRQQQIQQSLGC